MLTAYTEVDGRLIIQPRALPLAEALWIDLYDPDAAEVARINAMGYDVPTLAEMEEIELSNRLYREGDIDTMTVVMSGQAANLSRITAPVSFVLGPRQLITVRHHQPRAFETYPTRAENVGPGCASADQITLGLFDEIIGRQADHLEFAGRALDSIAAGIFTGNDAARLPANLQATLEEVGREGELLGKVRLALLTMGRAVGFLGKTLSHRGDESLNGYIAGLLRDIESLEVHADFLSTRVALSSDATLGMINLAQNATVRSLSVVAVLFLPPTLISSIYGMNFDLMPELHLRFGYPVAVFGMLASAVLTYLYFKWRKWL